MMAVATPTIQIVELLHPGVEYKPKCYRADPHVTWHNDMQKRSGTRKWNFLPNHKRKFMKSLGEYATELDGTVHKGHVTFWGEWEAQSKFQIIGRNKSQSPYCVHEPFLDLTSTDKRQHNTDPYVFGDSFWYTNCQQHRYSSLTKLAPGSVVLFGSRMGSPRQFCLDTVFVVEKAFDSDDIEQVVSKASEQLKHTNFCWEANDDVAVWQNTKFKFYRAMMKCRSSGFFSFVPGKPLLKVESGSLSHERPMLSPYHAFGLRKGQTMGSARLFPSERIDGALPETFVKEYWTKIARHCISQGFCLITKIDEPGIVR